MPAGERDEFAARGELFLVAGLAALALTLRLPHLLTLPEITDETVEIAWAMKVGVGGWWPAVAGDDAYDGPLFIYLLAGLFEVFGTHVWLPRLFMALCGTATVLVTYALGRQLSGGDRRVGAIAALLLAVNGHHIFMNSHVAWSNCTTPFFASVAVFLYVRATRGGRLAPAALVGAGMVYGLALQTHPSVLALAPAFAIDFLLAAEGRRSLGGPLPYLALAAALVVYSPVVVHNLATGFDGLRVAETSRSYGFEPAPGLEKAAGSAGPLLAMIARMALGSFGPVTWKALLLSPRLLAVWAGTFAAVAWLARRGQRFPLIALATSLVFFALFSRYNVNPRGARYYTFLLPLIFTVWAEAATAALAAGGSLTEPVWRPHALLAAVIGLLALPPPFQLGRYYRQLLAKGFDNGAMLEMVGSIDGRAPVLLDANLFNVRSLNYGGSVGRGLESYLSLEGGSAIQFHPESSAQMREVREIVRDNPHGYLIVSSRTQTRFAAGPTLRPVMTASFPCPACRPLPNEFTLLEWRRAHPDVAPGRPPGSRLNRHI